MPTVLSANPARMTSRGAPAAGPSSGEDRDGEHRQRERSDGQARLQGVVLELDLQEDRQRDHRPAERDVLEHLPGEPDPEVREREQLRIEQRHLPLAVAPHEPAGERPQRERADRDQQQDVVPALLPHEDAEHHAAHPDHGQDRAAQVDLPLPRVRDVLEQPELRQHDRDDHGLEQEADAPRQVGGDEAAEERADRGGDRGRRSDERIGLLLRRPLEVAVDEGLHRGQQQRGAEAADERPEHDDRRQALGERHRHRADRVAEETQDVRPFASEQVTDLAADQDERRRHQRLERDRALDGAHRRVEVLDDGRDRHVHQGRVDHEHEHRRRQHDREARAPRFLMARARGHRSAFEGPRAPRRRAPWP